MASDTNTIQRLTSASCILLVLAVGWTNSEDTDLVINKPGLTPISLLFIQIVSVIFKSLQSTSDLMIKPYNA